MFGTSCGSGDLLLFLLPNLYFVTVLGLLLASVAVKKDFDLNHLINANAVWGIAVLGIAATMHSICLDVVEPHIHSVQCDCSPNTIFVLCTVFHSMSKEKKFVTK